MKNIFTTNTKRNIKITILIILFTGINYATTVNGRILRESENDTLFSIKLQINTDTGIDKMGGATYVIKYDTSQLSFPDFPIAGRHYLFHNFTGGSYSSALVTKVVNNKLWLNIELDSDNQGFIVSGNNAWTDLVTLNFIKKVSSPLKSISWESSDNFWTVFGDDNSTLWSAGNFNNIVTNIEQNKISNENFELMQNYPNPFNPSTTISFNLKNSGNVNLTVYNILGEVVETLINSNMNSGNHKINFNASDLASGIYIYRLSVNNSYTAIKKMILLK